MKTSKCNFVLNVTENRNKLLALRTYDTLWGKHEVVCSVRDMRFTFAYARHVTRIEFFTLLNCSHKTMRARDLLRLRRVTLVMSHESICFTMPTASI